MLTDSEDGLKYLFEAVHIEAEFIARTLIEVYNTSKHYYFYSNIFDGWTIKIFRFKSYI